MKKVLSFLNEEIHGISLKEVITVSIILILYGILAFYRLGNTYGVQSFYRTDADNEIIFSFDEETDVIKMKYFTGENNAVFRIYESSDNEEYFLVDEVDSIESFTWKDVRIARKSKYIKFEILDAFSMGEVAFYNNQKEYIPYKTTTTLLNDEKDLIPDHMSYMNSSYFDEVYFARTAYQYAHGMQTFEWTHPPLGKIIQAIPIFLFHTFNPFLYRFMGTFAGILMLLVLYVFGAVLFKKRGYAILSSFLMAIDTFHYAHTRMGTVDSHLVLFIMISSLFMLLYLQKNKNYFLLLSGIFFGFSISVKWTGFYAGLGLAIVYFYDFIKNKKDLLESIVKGSVFFVVIPFIIYTSWFLLFPNNFYHTDSLNSVVKEQKIMYEYHSSMNLDHPFSSSWYTWPISYKPVWYHQTDLMNDSEESISGVGNFILWIGGIFGFFYCVYRIFKKDKNAFFLVVVMLSLWLPYIFIGRVMFLYHYFPVLPFLFLGTVLSLKELTEEYHSKLIIPVYLFLGLLFFILYFPVISGQPVTYKYADWLKIFYSWYF